jgi:hypothetical protein
MSRLAFLVLAAGVAAMAPASAGAQTFDGRWRAVLAGQGPLGETPIQSAPLLRRGVVIRDGKVIATDGIACERSVSATEEAPVEFVAGRDAPAADAGDFIRRHGLTDPVARVLSVECPTGQVTFVRTGRNELLMRSGGALYLLRPATPDERTLSDHDFVLKAAADQPESTGARRAANASVAPSAWAS